MNAIVTSNFAQKKEIKKRINTLDYYTTVQFKMSLVRKKK